MSAIPLFHQVANSTPAPIFSTPHPQGVEWLFAQHAEFSSPVDTQKAPPTGTPSKSLHRVIRIPTFVNAHSKPFFFLSFLILRIQSLSIN